MSKKQKPVRPTIFEVRAAFNPLDNLIAALESGEITAGTIDGKEELYFTADNGDQFPVSGVLTGWIRCWDRLIRMYHLKIDQAPLRVIDEKLNSDIKLTPEEVAAAKECINLQRNAYRMMDVYQIREAANAEQIALYLEEEKEAA